MKQDRIARQMTEAEILPMPKTLLSRIFEHSVS